MLKTFIKRSIGKLRPAKVRTKPKSPDFIGDAALQPPTLSEIYRQMQNAPGDEIIVNIAGWVNTDSAGKYITIEISPRFPKSQPHPSTPQPNRLLDQFFEEDDSDAV